MAAYGFCRELRIPFGQALETILGRLEDHGFDVLTVIDVKKEFKETLDLDFKQYVILGASHPVGIPQVMDSDEDIGLPWPCVVIIYERSGKTVVSAIRSTTALPVLQDLDLQEIADVLEVDLQSMLSSVN
jgi:uncharacterized protein (DUF302 family)